MTAFHIAQVNVGRLRAPVDEALDRLQHLRTHGPTATAFTFRAPFGPPGSTAPVDIDDGWKCTT